jgi:hypothetical protein
LTVQAWWVGTAGIPFRAVTGLSETSAVDSAGGTSHSLGERGAVGVQVFAH